MFKLCCPCCYSKKPEPTITENLIDGQVNDSWKPDPVPLDKEPTKSTDDTLSTSMLRNVSIAESEVSTSESKDQLTDLPPFHKEEDKNYIHPSRKDSDKSISNVSSQYSNGEDSSPGVLPIVFGEDWLTQLKSKLPNYPQSSSYRENLDTIPQLPSKNLFSHSNPNSKNIYKKGMSVLVPAAVERKLSSKTEFHNKTDRVLAFIYSNVKNIVSVQEITLMTSVSTSSGDKRSKKSLSSVPVVFVLAKNQYHRVNPTSASQVSYLHILQQVTGGFEVLRWNESVRSGNKYFIEDTLTQVPLLFVSDSKLSDLITKTV